jgi:hypothetical protein
MKARANAQQDGVTLPTPPHTTPAKRVSPSGIIPSAGLFGAGLGITLFWFIINKLWPIID